MLATLIMEMLNLDYTKRPTVDVALEKLRRIKAFSGQQSRRDLPPSSPSTSVPVAPPVAAAPVVPVPAAAAPVAMSVDSSPAPAPPAPLPDAAAGKPLEEFQEKVHLVRCAS